MAYWWVNQGQTYAEEREGGYLWSPKLTRNGQRRPYYDAMIEAAPDDLIFHYVSRPNQRVESLSAVVDHAVSQAQPAELRHTDMWNDDGWLLPVRHVTNIRTIGRQEAISLGPGEKPFTKNGTVNQGYLYAISEAFGAALLDRADPAGLPPSVPAPGSPPSAEPRSIPGLEPETVDLEAGWKLEFEQVVTSARRAASRAEWLLVQSFVEASGIDPTRRRYRLSSGISIYADLFVPGARVLIEAKASADRSSVREAIGQLHDYEHKEPEPVSKVMLLPSEPAEDLLDLLPRLGIQAMWPGSPTWDAAVADVSSLSSRSVGNP